MQKPTSMLVSAVNEEVEIESSVADTELSTVVTESGDGPSQHQIISEGSLIAPDGKIT